MTAKLDNTTLAMIVRDEKMNPAGGVELMLRCHLPFVEEAVVVDTGSVDGTREVLEELQSQYPHLRVYDMIWNGNFADARNKSLMNVKTDKVLVLDADELVVPEDIEKATRILQKGYESIFLRFMEIADREYHGSGMNPRIFSKTAKRKTGDISVKYVKSCSEMLNFDFGELFPYRPLVRHFMQVDLLNLLMSKKDWYEGGAFKTQQPIVHAREHGWKQFNPQRLNYYFPPEIKDKEAFLRERGAELPVVK